MNNLESNIPEGDALEENYHDLQSKPQHQYAVPMHEREFFPTPIGIIYEESSLIGSIHDERFNPHIYSFCFYLIIDFSQHSRRKTKLI
jgi:hypothetical protein